MQTDHDHARAHGSTSQERIFGFLSRVDRRLRRNEALGAVTAGLWGFVGLLVVVKLAGWWDSPLARWSWLGAYGVVFAVFVSWRYGRAKSLERSAAVADARADLKDSLKSALAFLGVEPRSEWMELHIDRSADKTDELSPREIAPSRVPKPLYYALGTGLVLASLFAWNPSWLRELGEAEFLTASQEEPIENVEDLLDETDPLAPEEEKLEELAEALDQLRRRDIELTESLQELSDAQEALAASRAEMERLEMDLEELGVQLESSPALAELSEALKLQNTEEAAKILRELADRLAEAQSTEEFQALLESLKNANVQNEELAEMMEDFEAAGDWTAEDLAQMAEALESMAQQMESMGAQMAAQDIDEMSEELQQLEASLAGQQTGEQEQMSQQQQAGGQSQSQSQMRSTQMQMAQMQGDASSAMPVDAGPPGETTGPGGAGEEQVLGEATTLDVQLEMEVLTAEEQDEPVPEEIFERLSREEKSTLNYEDVQQPGSYSEESAMERERVPWQYRALVKRYFLTILTNSSKSSESTSEP